MTNEVGLKSELIRQALAMIARSGTQALTMREIARKVGVSPMAAYRHFANKEALLAAVAEEGFLDLRGKLVEADLNFKGDPIAAIRVLCLEYVKFAITHPHHYALMFGPEPMDRDGHVGLRGAAEESFAALVSVVRKARDAGRLRDGIDPIEASASIHSLVHGLASLILHQRMDRRFPKNQRFEEVVLRLVSHYIHGIASRD